MNPWWNNQKSETTPLTAEELKDCFIKLWLDCGWPEDPEQRHQAEIIELERLLKK